MKSKVFWLFVAIAVFLLIASTVNAQSGIFNVYLPVVYKSFLSTPTPPPSGVYVLDNHIISLEADGYHRRVTGEVFNNTSMYLSGVGIGIDFFNGSQNVGGQHIQVPLDLSPYEKTCFKMGIVNLFPSWTSYSFHVEYGTGGKARPNLIITNHSGGIIWGTVYRISGQIRNDDDGKRRVRDIRVYATMYDDAGKVIDCAEGSVLNKWGAIDPGQSDNFQVDSHPLVPSAVASYTLQTDGLRCATEPLEYPCTGPIY